MRLDHIVRLCNFLAYGAYYIDKKLWIKKEARLIEYKVFGAHNTSFEIKPLEALSSSNFEVEIFFTPFCFL